MLPEQAEKIKKIQERKKHAELDERIKGFRREYIMMQIKQYTKIREDSIKLYADEISQSNRIRQLFLGDTEAQKTFDEVLSMSQDFIRENENAIRRYEEYCKNI
jgi:hypothetical protein